MQNKVKKKIKLMVAFLLVVAMQIPVEAGEKVVTIKMVQSSDGARVFFDPVGILIEPGTTVRWIQQSNYHTVTAYHPSNGNRELRIPDTVRPWDSGVLTSVYPQAGSTFTYTFQINGVYDYFCRPHELAGMAGRIVVGAPNDRPKARPFGHGANAGRKPIPEAVATALPPVERIMRHGMLQINLDSPIEGK